jgi:hypothetical protein
MKQPSAQGERTAWFDSNGVNWQWDGGSSVVQWKTYVRWMETNHQILLLVPNTVLYRPKTCVERGANLGIANAVEGENSCRVDGLAGAKDATYER